MIAVQKLHELQKSLVILCESGKRGGETRAVSLGNNDQGCTKMWWSHKLHEKIANEWHSYYMALRVWIPSVTIPCRASASMISSPWHSVFQVSTLWDSDAQASQFRRSWRLKVICQVSNLGFSNFQLPRQEVYCEAWLYALLAGKHVVFGHVSEGMDVVKKVETYGSGSGKTKAAITITNSGQL